MSRNLLSIAIVAGIFGVSAPKGAYLDIQKILDDIPSRDTRDLEYIHKLFSNTRNRHGHGNKRHHKSSPNLMNVQTMNLYMKPNKRNLEQFPKTDSMCKEPGRCGCTGTRCGDLNRAEDEVANEVDQLIDDVNRQLERDGMGTSDSKSDTDEEMDILRCDGDRCGYGRSYDNYDDRVENSDEVAIVLLDAGNLDKLKTNEIQDLTKNYLTLGKDESTEKRSQNVYILDLNKNPTTTDLGAPTPDDFVNHYEIVKNDVIKQLLNYIQNNTPIPLKHLQDKQKQLLKTLKNNYKLGLVKPKDLKTDIVQIVFGEKSGTKIYPHTENNDNIYIPKWHYNSLLQYKKDLRSKRVLPLTTQQRERILNKQTKTIPKLAWRRSFDENVQKYGIPFNLQVHGLGQLNP